MALDHGDVIDLCRILKKYGVRPVLDVIAECIDDNWKNNTNTLWDTRPSGETDWLGKDDAQTVVNNLRDDMF